MLVVSRQLVTVFNHFDFFMNVVRTQPEVFIKRVLMNDDWTQSCRMIGCNAEHSCDQYL